MYKIISALVILTLHSHLSKSEVIGLMGGTYARDRRLLRIEKIVPCKSLPTKDDYHNVEMDPVSKYFYIYIVLPP